MGYAPQLTARIDSRNGVGTIALSGEFDIQPCRSWNNTSHA